MAKLSMTKIKEMVLANCGGLAGKSDSEIKRFWNTLQPKTREHYIEKAKVKSKNESKPSTDS